MRDLQQLEIDKFLAQAETLASLTAHPAWEVYASLIKAMRQSAMEELATCPDPGEVRFWQGAIGALGEVLSRTSDIIGMAGAFQAEEEADIQRTRPELRAIMGLGMDDSDSL